MWICEVLSSDLDQPTSVLARYCIKVSLKEKDKIKYLYIPSKLTIKTHETNKHVFVLFNVIPRDSNASSVVLMTITSVFLLIKAFLGIMQI
jgi:hypothetical protein